ncbi:MAG: glycoside hydrolase [Candidatus Eremiobacteraeota bacterium]|nr:glycoside hydrolase [Candidatus Eremiobacteraeota bacterium]
MIASRWNVLPLVLAITTLAPAAAAAQTVTPNVMVDSDSRPTRWYDVPSLAVSPGNPNALALADVELQTGKCLTHLSLDGGRTWVNGGDPDSIGYSNCAMPNGNVFSTAITTALAFDKQGTLYYAFTAARPQDGYSASLLLGRSKDGGKTFTTSVISLQPPQADAEKAMVDYTPAIAIDDSGDGPARVYVAFKRGYGDRSVKLGVGYLASSDDGGRTFHPPVRIPAHVRQAAVVVSKGNVVVPFGESTGKPAPAPAHLYAAISSDRGKTFTVKPIETLTKYYVSPLAAVNPTNGTIAIAFHEATLTQRGTAQDAVMVKTSTDGGQTWGDSVAVSPIGQVARDKNADQLFPMLSFAPSGRLDVAWYDYRNDPFAVPSTARTIYLGKAADVYLASSTDDGKTFGPAVRVNDHPIDRQIGTWTAQYFVVPPPAIASTDRGAFVAWSDTRNGNPDSQSQDIYFAQADSTGSTYASGSASASGSFGSKALVAVVGAFLLGAGFCLILVAFVLRSRRPAS